MVRPIRLLRFPRPCSGQVHSGQVRPGQTGSPFIFLAIVIGVLAGCEPQAEREKRFDRPERLTVEGLLSKEKELLAAGKELLTVDFQEGQILRYKFISSRDIIIDWDPQKKQSRRGKSSIDKSSESMEMIVSYEPVEVNPFGLTTIKATCESAKIRRSKNPHTDAVESLSGKTFTFTVDPTGIIEDYLQLTALIEEAGEKAFQRDTGRGRIKEPDMIGDFASAQWFLWDSISSIEKATDGVSVGQSWKSKLPVTGPMVMRKARGVTYTLAEIRPFDTSTKLSAGKPGAVSNVEPQSEKGRPAVSEHSPRCGAEHRRGRLAVIRSSYSPAAESVPDNWPPLPYSGRFQMRGTFGFLKGYKILDLQGQGEELFNIDAGRIERYNQQYQVKLQASIPFGIDVKPQITMKQNFKMQLL